MGMLAISTSIWMFGTLAENSFQLCCYVLSVASTFRLLCDERRAKGCESVGRSEDWWWWWCWCVGVSLRQWQQKQRLKKSGNTFAKHITSAATFMQFPCLNSWANIIISTYIAQSSYTPTIFTEGVGRDVASAAAAADDDVLFMPCSWAHTHMALAGRPGRGTGNQIFVGTGTGCFS